MTFSELKNATAVLDDAIKDYESVKAANQSLAIELAELKQTISKAGYAVEKTDEGVYELIESDTEEMPAGDYLNPIPYELGMVVQKDMWYTDGENIWECLNNGTPDGFGDTEYFDIIDL